LSWRRRRAISAPVARARPRSAPPERGRLVATRCAARPAPGRRRATNAWRRARSRCPMAPGRQGPLRRLTRLMRLFATLLEAAAAHGRAGRTVVDTAKYLQVFPNARHVCYNRVAQGDVSPSRRRGRTPLRRGALCTLAISRQL